MRSSRNACSRAAASRLSRSWIDAVMRATNQAIMVAETTKVSHIPARCRRVARSASATGSGRYCHINSEYSAMASSATAAVRVPGRDNAATATGTSRKEISGLAAPPDRYNRIASAARSTHSWPNNSLALTGSSPGARHCT